MSDAPAWLREAFKDGVDEREMVYRDGVERFRLKRRPYAGANPWCWLAQFDPKRIPCAGQSGHLIERFHFLRRQTVENAMELQLVACGLCDFGELEIPEGRATCPSCQGHGMPGRLRAESVLLAAWDPRAGGLGCEHHHRRFDHHAGSPAAPSITVPAFALPEHVDLYIADYGLDQVAEETFEDYEVDGDRAYLQPAGR